MHRATARGTRDPLRRPPAPHSRETRTNYARVCQQTRLLLVASFVSWQATTSVERLWRRSAAGRREVRWATRTPRRSRVQTRTTRSPMQLLALQMVLPHAPVPVPVAFAVASHATCIRVCIAPAASALPVLCLAPRSPSIADARSRVAPGVHALPCSNASPDTLILRVCPHRAPGWHSPRGVGAA